MGKIKNIDNCIEAPRKILYTIRIIKTKNPYDIKKDMYIAEVSDAISSMTTESETLKGAVNNLNKMI